MRRLGGFTLLIAISSVSWAHDPTSFVYFAPHTPSGTSITVDGDLADWSWYPSILEITTEQAFVHAGPDIFDPDDFDWKLRVAWNGGDNRLYLAFEIFDDVLFPYETVGERETYLYDNFQVIVDADHSGGLYQGFDVPEDEQGVQAQQWMFPLGGPSDGYHFVYLHGGATWYQNAPYSEYAYRAIDANRHVGEIALTLFDAAAQEGPEVSLPHELYVDDIIGLSCLYDDHDEEGLVHDGQWKTHESGDGVVDATVIAHFVLVPDPAGVAAVEAETWARLKSGLAGRINSR